MPRGNSFIKINTRINKLKNKFNIKKTTLLFFDTRPWKLYGEGPASDVVKPGEFKSFTEGKVKLSSNDIRYNKKGKVLYATLLGVASKNIQILGRKEKLSWKQYTDSLVIVKTEDYPERYYNSA